MIGLYITINSFLVSSSFCCLLMTFASCLDPDQDQHFVSPDLEATHLTLWSVSETIFGRKKLIKKIGVIFHDFFLSSADFYQNLLFQRNSFRNTIRMANSLDPDQAQDSVGPDLGPYCLQRSAADSKIRGWQAES